MDREVVFVDGVRTAFGRAGEKGIFWRTRADDMGVKVVRELLRRSSSRTTFTAMSSPRVLQKIPCAPARPNAVRTPSTYTTSRRSTGAVYVALKLVQ